METARKYTDLNPENEADAVLLVHIFMGQSSADIKWKLQKLEGAEACSLDKMLENAWKVYNNREKVEEEKQRKEKFKDNNMLAAAIAQETGRTREQGYRGPRRRRFPSGAPRARIPIEKDQCAYCKQKGHWKRECPQLNQQSFEEMPRQAINMMTLDSD